MSLATQVASLASRIATEFKSVRTAIAGKANTVHTHTLSQITDYVDPTINMDGGTASSVFGGSVTITGGNASGV